MPGVDQNRRFVPVGIAVLTVSDTRSAADDVSGTILAERIEAAGHRLAGRQIVRDEVAAIRQVAQAWIDDTAVDVILATGGTGITGRDVTPDALEALYTKPIPGFGELFRWLSYQTIGTSTIQSRASGGLAGSTLIFALPGSRGAVKDAWDQILVTQLDHRFRPCNFVELMPRFDEP